MRAVDQIALLLAVSIPNVALAQQAPAHATKPAGYSVADTQIGTMLGDPAAKAILDKHMPGFSSQAQIDKARLMTLRHIQPYASDMVTDEALARIQADFATLSANE
ncbi:hypothetical protein [Sphingobium aromaticiconvertens]|uniref:hypothetical protein n=1 Tax=Sphingobium aromaticiconvertens TaxID=365341 RepID=UPI003019EAA1